MFVSVRGEKKESGFGSRNSHVIPVNPGLGHSGSFTEGKVVGSRMGADSTKFKSSAYWVVREAAEGISAMKKLKREGDRQEP